MLKTMLVIYDQSEAARAALDYACFLASQNNGKIYLGHIIDMPSDPLLASGIMVTSIDYLSAIPPVDAGKELDAELHRREEEAQRLLAEGAAQCARRGVRCETLSMTGFAEEQILERTGYVDLLVLGKPAMGQWPADARTADAPPRLQRLTEAVLRGASQPVLVPAPPFRAPEEVVLLYTPGTKAQHALAQATQLTSLARLPLLLVTAAPTLTEGEALQALGRRYLSDHGVTFQSEILEGEEETDAKLVQWLRGHPAALVVMGSFGHSWVRQLLMGSTTRAILRSTDLPVVFSH